MTIVVTIGVTLNGVLQNLPEAGIQVWALICCINCICQCVCFSLEKSRNCSTRVLLTVSSLQRLIRLHQHKFRGLRCCWWQTITKIHKLTILWTATHGDLRPRGNDHSVVLLLQRSELTEPATAQWAKLHGLSGLNSTWKENVPAIWSTRALSNSYWKIV